MSWEKPKAANESELLTNKFTLILLTIMLAKLATHARIVILLILLEDSKNSSSSFFKHK